jgi:hypothetical protein
MTLEQDLHKLEGEIYPIEVLLNAADGAVNTDIYEVYGAAEAGRTRHSFSVKTTDKPGAYLVEIPALSFTKNPYWDYQICARRKTTGHEWLIMQGHIKLRYRIADVPDVKIGAPQQTFVATLSADLLKVEVHEIAGVKGDRGYSAYEIACQNGFEGTEKEWLESLKHDAAQEAIATVEPFKDVTSADADAAHNSAQQAALSASEAKQSASDAQESMRLAQESAEDAINSMHTAKEDAEKAAKDAEDTADYLAAVRSLADEVTTNKEHVDVKAAEVSANAQEAARMADAAANSAINASADANNAAGSAEAAKQSEELVQECTTRAEAAAYNAEQAKQAAAAERAAAAEMQAMSTQAAQDAINAQTLSETAAINALESAAAAEKSKIELQSTLKGDKGDPGEKGDKGDKGDPGLTAEQLELLTLFASAEGRNIPISEDGEIVTEIGHTYTITAGEQAVKCTDADFNPLCEVAAHKQTGFVAPSTAAYVDNVTCTVTEVFRAAAPVELSGNGGGEPEGDYVTLDANGCITSGRLDTLVDGSYLQHNKPTLTSWDIDLPALSNGANMFYNCRLDKDSALVVLSSLPAYESGVHVLTLGMHKSYEGDADILAAIDAAQANGWTIRAQYQEENTLPANFTQVEYIGSTGTQYIDTGLRYTSDDVYSQTLELSIIDKISLGNTGCNYIGWCSVQDGNYHMLNAGMTPIGERDIICNKFLDGERFLYINGSEVARQPIESGVFINIVAGIFSLGTHNNKWFSTNQNIKAKLYFAEFTKNNMLVRNMIPALDPTGAPCLYDLIEKKAYYNAGTGDFIYPSEATTYSLRRVLPDWGKLTERGLKRLYHAPEGYTGELIDYALENGYKPIIEPEMPAEGYWTPQWRETEDEIVLDWIETEAPEMEE